MSDTTAADESLLEHFTCLVCFEYMDKKIYICVNGHSICGGCNSKVSKCPVCNVKQSSLRNISLEKAAKKVKEWKGKQKIPERATIISKGIDVFKRKTRLSLGSPVRIQPDDFTAEDHIQCPYSKCCYFTKQLLQLKMHLQSWHFNKLYNIKKCPEVLTETVIRVRMFLDLNEVHRMFVLTSSDTYFIVYIVKTSNLKRGISHIVNVLTVSDKTKMFKFTCGNTSKFSMFYQGRHQAQDGIEVHSDTIETHKSEQSYKNIIRIFITRVAAL